MATAVQVESIWNGLTDNSGEPLASGKVYTYYAGTSTPVALYTASDKSTSATNPLILDGNGKAQVWADGRYKFVVKSAADVTLYTLDNLLYGFDDSTVLWGGQSTGAANAQVVSVPATVGVYANGQRVSFVAGYTNTGAVTLQLNALSAVSVVKGPNAVSLQAGDIVAGQLVDCVYEAYSGTGRFRLENYPTLGDVQRSRFQLATNVAANSSTVTADLTPALTSYETGLAVRLKIVTTSSGPVTLNLNGLGPKAVQLNNAALVAGELQANYWHELVYDGTQFQLLNPAMSASTRTLPITVAQIQDSAVVYGGTSTGSANAQAINLSPDITAYTAGQRFIFKAGFTNTGATTLAVDGITPAVAIQRFGAALVGGEIQLNDMVEVVYNGTAFQLENSTPAPLFIDRTNSRVGIGTTTPTSALQVSGTIDNTPDAAGVHIGLASNYACMELCEATGGIIDFTTAGVDNKGRIIYTHSTNTMDIVTNGVTRASVDGSGDVGIGASVPAGGGTRLYVKKDVSGYGGITVDNTDQRLTLTSNFVSGVNQFGSIQATTVTGGLVNNLSLNPLGGAVMINKQSAVTSGSGTYFTQATAGYPALLINTKTWSGNLLAIQNHYNGTYVGGMNYSDTGTSFPTSSDYRLKENVVDLSDALERLGELKPRRFNFIIKPEETIDGFIAHEVQDVVPNAVEGQKDAINEDGSIKIQSIDHSKLIPLLTAAIQELHTKVESLEARIAALEA